jgi:hypothetical protein
MSWRLAWQRIVLLTIELARNIIGQGKNIISKPWSTITFKLSKSQRGGSQLEVLQRNGRFQLS